MKKETSLKKIAETVSPVSSVNENINELIIEKGKYSLLVKNMKDAKRVMRVKKENIITQDFLKEKGEDFNYFDSKNSSNYRCINCVNCNRCHNCTNCEYCDGCLDCINCYSCDECLDCTNCYSCDECNNCKNCGNCYECINCKICISCSNCNDCVYCGGCSASESSYDCFHVCDEKGAQNKGVLKNKDYIDFFKKFSKEKQKLDRARPKSFFGLF